jgi:MFS superfamily sulfate permease-like transporter
MKKLLKNAAHDIPASIVVLLVAVPLCLGIALASKVPEFSGIIAGIVGGIVVGILSGSPLSVTGPAAGLTAVVASSLTTMPMVDEKPVLGAFFLAVFIAGIIQLIMGIIKLGIIGDYVPNSVIKGMLAAIGIILILKQIPHLVGYDKDPEGDEAFKLSNKEDTFTSLVNAFKSPTYVAIIIGIVGLAILIFYETKWIKKQKIFTILSGPLVVVVAGIILHRVLVLPSEHSLEVEHMVNIPVAANAEEFFSFFKLPSWEYFTHQGVWITAFTIAMVASLETLLSIEAVDKLDPYKRITPANRELFAQGTGNIVSGLLGGLPVTSVIVRSSANVNAGGRTKLSAILHGVLLLLCVFFIPNILNLIPKAALAAILIFTGYKLAKVSLFKEYYRRGWDQFVPFVVTVVAIILTDLLKGVAVGMIVALFYTLRSNYRSSIMIVNNSGDYLVRLRKDVSYLNKPKLKHLLEKLPENASVLIDASRADFIDKDVIDVINDFIDKAHHKNISVEVKKNHDNLFHHTLKTATPNN